MVNAKQIKQIKQVKTGMTVKVLTGSDAINKAITSIATRGKAIDRDIHTVAVSTLVHADKHGDITLANKLLAAMPKSTRTNALRDWFLAFGKFDFDAKSKAMVFAREKTSDITKATNTPFWLFKPEPVYVAFDAATFLATAIKRVEKAMNDGENVPEALIKGLYAINTAVGTETPVKDALAA